MAKFSFFSWNIRHFKGTPARLVEVDNFISQFDPDIFGLIEYRGKSSIRELMVDRFPEYDFAVTDSTGNLEVVVGVRRGKFDQIVWTQKRQFNDRGRKLRPGALISVRLDGVFYNLLFLHTDSGTATADYENRKKVFRKIWKLEKALAARADNGQANLVVLGDLNTMGKGRTISGESEIRRLARSAERNNMLMLDKDFDATWSNWGRGPRHDRKKLRIADLPGLMTSDLDHVIASKELVFTQEGDNGEPIAVRGWQQLERTEKINFLWDLSDHCALFGQVE